MTENAESSRNPIAAKDLDLINLSEEELSNLDIGNLKLLNKNQLRALRNKIVNAKNVLEKQWQELVNWQENKEKAIKIAGFQADADNPEARKIRKIEENLNIFLEKVMKLINEKS